MVESVIEGTWEEISLHASELAGKRMRVILLPEEGEAFVPNEGMLASLAEVKRLQDGTRDTLGEKTQDLLREARSGALYGLDAD